MKASTHKKAWWICPHDHEYEQAIMLRTTRGSGCPYCAGNKVWKGFNDLATTYPKIAKEWHPTKNGALTPHDITAGKFKPVWWLCPKCGHEWQASPNNRKKGVGCPCCSGRGPKPGVNDLGTKFPEISKEWCYEKNIPLTPKDVLPGSGKKVWWKCQECGHEWKTEIRIRTLKNSKCSSCSRNKNKNQIYFKF